MRAIWRTSPIRRRASSTSASSCRWRTTARRTRSSLRRLTITDTLDNEFEPLESESPFALPLGAPIGAGEEFPIANSIAADGPTQGSLIVYLIAESSTENRPLELEIPLPSGETGIVELDI